MTGEKINWSGKTKKDLETVFHTNTKKGLSRGRYAEAKEIYGENIIDSNILENRNFYGMEKKTFNFRAIFSRSAGILGISYIALMFVIKLLGFDIELIFYVPAYLFLFVSAFALSVLSEYKYYNLYKTARPRISAIRHGSRKKVSIESIVPGDIIMLSKGDIVPADAKIIESHNLSCVHKCRMFDGIYENVRQDKTHRVNQKQSYPTEFEPDILYASDIIEFGYAVAVVYATGANTLIMKKYKFTEHETHRHINNQSDGNTSDIQKNAKKVSNALFLLSIAFAVPAILFGILEQRDYISVIITCLTASAAAFSEQLTIIIDFALTFGMNKSAGFGAVIKKTADIDKLNKTDMLIAKKSEICAYDSLRLEAVYFADTDFEVSYENRHEIRYVLLNAAAVCGAENAAVTKAVREAADRMEADYRENKNLGKTSYDKSTGIKSAAVIIKGIRLACFGEAEKIIEKCSHQIIAGERFVPADIRALEKKLLAVYDKYDLVMALALKELDHSQVSLDDFVSDITELDFFAFFAFNEENNGEKNLSVRKEINNLKRLGITTVMTAESSGIYTYKTAVNFGIVGEHEDYAKAVIDDNTINNIENADLSKIRIITRLSEDNAIRLMRSLKSRGRYAAIMAGSVREAEILNESHLSFCHDNIKDEVLKNKANINIKDMSLKLILQTIKNANLIYQNVCNIMIFSVGLFTAQYMLIFFATLFNGAYILNTAQIIWTSVGAGFLCAVSIAANSEDSIEIKVSKIEKNSRKYYKTIRKRGIMTGLFIFLTAILTFFICFALQEKNIFSYINSFNFNSNSNENIYTAHTAAFLTYITACFAHSAAYIKNIRKNKFFIAAAVLNVIFAGLAITFKPLREYLNFGALDLKSACVAAAVGIAQILVIKLINSRKG